MTRKQSHPVRAEPVEALFMYINALRPFDKLMAQCER